MSKAWPILLGLLAIYIIIYSCLILGVFAEDETFDLCYNGKHEKRDGQMHMATEYHCHTYTRLWKDCPNLKIDCSDYLYFYWKETSVLYPERGQGPGKRIYLK